MSVSQNSVFQVCKSVLSLCAFTQTLGNGTESEVTLLKVRQEDRGKTWARESRPRQDLRQACHVSMGLCTLSDTTIERHCLGYLIVQVFIFFAFAIVEKYIFHFI